MNAIINVYNSTVSITRRGSVTWRSGARPTKLRWLVLF